MTDIEKFEERIAAVDAAIVETKHALTVDRKLTHDKHPNGNFTTALHALTSIRESLSASKIRFEATGR
jgi:hypothetical protein